MPFRPPVCPACRAPSVCLCREGARSVSNAGSALRGGRSSNSIVSGAGSCWGDLVLTCVRQAVGLGPCTPPAQPQALRDSLFYVAVASPAAGSCTGAEQACRWLPLRLVAAHVCLSLLEASAACASGMPGLPSARQASVLRRAAVPALPCCSRTLCHFCEPLACRDSRAMVFMMLSWGLRVQCRHWAISSRVTLSASLLSPLLGALVTEMAVPCSCPGCSSVGPASCYYVSHASGHRVGLLGAPPMCSHRARGSVPLHVGCECSVGLSAMGACTTLTGC